jgi:NDP-sugar pyrophosphorylase family protein
MSSPSELLLIQKYKLMVGLDQVTNISDSNKVFTISQISSLPSILNTFINLTGTTLINNITINSGLYVSGNSILQGNVSILGNLYISNNTIIHGLVALNNSILNNTTILSNLNVTGTAIFNNSINVDTINGLNNILNIYGNNITIGNTNSIVNINGTTNYIMKSQSVYQNKLFVY